MNEIAPKTVVLEPAKIEFNHKEILQDLETNLKKYDKLTFTEDETAELRKTLAELRKGTAAVNKYRIATKKELNAPVTAFENQCKEIATKIDERITKLDKQLKDFEVERKAKKTVKAQEIIANVINAFPNLEKKYTDRLIVEQDYLNKTATNKRIEETVAFTAEQFMQEQEIEHANHEVIETFVRLKNSEHDINLAIEPYLSFLNFKPVQEVKQAIDRDVQTILSRISREQAEKQAKEELDHRFEKVKEVVKDIPEPKFDPMDLPFTPSIDDLPFGDVEEKNKFVISLNVTESEMDLISTFLDGQGIEWEVVGNGNV